MTRLEDLTEQEITRRVPVWTALANLFLDTDVGECDFGYTARVIKAAGYTPADAELMLKFEVAPIFFRNTLGPPGEWAPFQETYVRRIVLKRLGKFRLWERIPYWRGLWYAFQTSSVKDFWVRVEAHFRADSAD